MLGTVSFVSQIEQQGHQLDDLRTQLSSSLDEIKSISSQAASDQLRLQHELDASAAAKCELDRKLQAVREEHETALQDLTVLRQSLIGEQERRERQDSSVSDLSLQLVRT